MLDPRVTKLAKLLTTHSTDLSKDDSVLIHAFDVPAEALAEIVRVARETGANVVLRIEDNRARRQMMLGMDERNAALIADIEKYEMERMTAYISIRGAGNSMEMADVPGDIVSMWSRIYSTPVVFETRVPNTKWVALRWPNAGMAQQASMSTDGFENFYFDVCTLDYKKMERACEPLKELMDNTDHVKIVGPGTEFEFSIKGIGSVPCVGHRNIPDGECFSCPTIDSANGVVQYNTASLYQGTVFQNVRYVVKNGKIVEATAGDKTDKLNEILDTDEGARRFGEWSLGFNPHVLTPMLDTLFDEKIAGSFHLTPGNSYPPPGGNGNKSAIHWDKVVIQRPEYGGGEIWFDGKLIRKDGIFTQPQLDGLNPDKLAK